MISLLQTLVTTSACTPSTLNLGGWIQINVLVVLAFLSIVSMVYGFSNLLPNQRREQMRRILIAEYGEAMFSLFIIAILVTLAYATCSAGAAVYSGLPSASTAIVPGLTTSTTYLNIFQADGVYIGNLVFGTGTALGSEIIIQGFLLQMDAQFANGLLTTLETSNPLTFQLSGTSSGGTTTKSTLQVEYGGDLAGVFYAFANVYPVTYGPLVVLTFGVLLMLFLLLPVISATVLPFLLPFVIIMRSLAFTGPKLREAANALLALCVALYFVLPLTIAMNGYIVNWLYCGPGITACNPNYNFLGPSSSNAIPISTFFTQNSAPMQLGSSPLSVPTNFFGSIAAGSGGGIGLVKTLATGLVNLPVQLYTVNNQVAQYLFQGIVLIALDFVITMGFAQGLNKGLNAIPGLLGSGSFWGE